MQKQWKQWENLFIYLFGGGDSKITAACDCSYEIKKKNKTKQKKTKQKQKTLAPGKKSYDQTAY